MAQQAQWMVAQDTFAADLESGSAITVVKGQHLLSTHEVVKLDAGRGILFKPAETGEEEPPAAVPKPASPRRAAPKAGA